MTDLNITPNRRRKYLLLPAAVLMAGSIAAVQPEVTHPPAPPAQTVAEPAGDAPRQGFIRKDNSFAPTVEKVAPAVVRLIVKMGYGNLAELAGRVALQE